MRLGLTWHHRTSDLPGSLWRDCFSAPREGLFWYRALESGKLEAQFTLLFGLLHNDGLPIGIVPVFIFDLPLELVMPPEIARFVMPLMRGPLRRLAYQRTLFIGTVAGEEGQVGLLPGYALRDVAPFLHAAVRAQAKALKVPMLVWKEFPDSARIALDSLLTSTRAFRVVSYPGTVIPLDSGGYEAYLAKQRSARRWKIKDKLRRGASNLPLRTTIVKRPRQPTLDEIFLLFWQTYLRGKTKFERLTPEFFRAIADSDEATFVVQCDAASGKILSFMLMLDLGERVVNQFIGIDYGAAPNAFLYFRLFAAAYDWASTTTRATVLQSGQTGYMAKFDLGHALVPLWNYCEHRNRMKNSIYRNIASRVTWDTLDDQLAEYLHAHPELRPAA
jgi:hypothetical protein